MTVFFLFVNDYVSKNYILNPVSLFSECNYVEIFYSAQGGSFRSTFVFYVKCYFLQQVPDVGVELTGGCYGFAAKYMHWPEELLIGGARHNKTGHLTRAAALQTVVQLMGERELYDFLANTYKVHHIDWSQEKAAQVLETWQRAFSNEVKKRVNMNASMPYNMNAFSTTTLNDILGKYSEVSVMKIAIGGALMVRNQTL